MKATQTNYTEHDGQEPTFTVQAANCADNLEMELQRILKRVPPIITLPQPKERCPYTSQSRTSMLELVAPCERNGFTPPVRAIYRRSHKHAVRGRWLIPSENLFRYLLGLSAGSADAYRKMAAERKQNREAGQ